MSRPSRVVVTGYLGQDGQFLISHLLKSSCEIYGLSRHVRVARLAEPHHRIEIDVGSRDFSKVIQEIRPDYVYHLAAFHHSSQDLAHGSIKKDLDLFEESWRTNSFSTLQILDVVSQHVKHARVFVAGSCHVFGSVDQSPQVETTGMVPHCAYGLSKYNAGRMIDYYRKKFGVFACTGILYQHESPLRGPQFVSQKIVRAAVAIKRGQKIKLVLRDLAAVVDWSATEDIVEAMTLILKQDTPADYIISSGIPRRVQDFVEATFSALDLPWREWVEQEDLSSQSLAHGLPKVGDSSRLRKETGWDPKVSFEKMIANLLAAEWRRVETC